MNLKPLPEEQVQNTVQILLGYLSDPRNATPNDQLEGIMSGKSLLRGILAGNLFICQQVVPEKEQMPVPPAAVEIRDVPPADAGIDDPGSPPA